MVTCLELKGETYIITRLNDKRKIVCQVQVFKGIRDGRDFTPFTTYHAGIKDIIELWDSADVQCELDQYATPGLVRTPGKGR